MGNLSFNVVYPRSSSNNEIGFSWKIGTVWHSTALMFLEQSSGSYEATGEPAAVEHQDYSLLGGICNRNSFSFVIGAIGIGAMHHVTRSNTRWIADQNKYNFDETSTTS